MFVGAEGVLHYRLHEITPGKFVLNYISEGGEDPRTALGPVVQKLENLLRPAGNIALQEVKFLLPEGSGKFLFNYPWAPQLVAVEILDRLGRWLDGVRGFRSCGVRGRSPDPCVRFPGARFNSPQMNLGVGLYRHMLTPENFAFARQAGATHIVAHLVDYFRGGNHVGPDDQPTGTDWGWGLAGDPEKPWTLEDFTEIRRDVEAAGLKLEAIENFDPAHWHDILLDGP